MDVFCLAPIVWACMESLFTVLIACYFKIEELWHKNADLWFCLKIGRPANKRTKLRGKTPFKHDLLLPLYRCPCSSLLSSWPRANVSGHFSSALHCCFPFGSLRRNMNFSGSSGLYQDFPRGPFLYLHRLSVFEMVTVVRKKLSRNWCKLDLFCFAGTILTAEAVPLSWE